MDKCLRIKRVFLLSQRDMFQHLPSRNANVVTCFLRQFPLLFPILFTELNRANITDNIVLAETDSIAYMLIEAKYYP